MTLNERRRIAGAALAMTALSDGTLPFKTHELITGIKPPQLDVAAAHGAWVAGAHLSFPGIGHLRAAAKGYEFVPANYSALH